MKNTWKPALAALAMTGAGVALAPTHAAQGAAPEPDLTKVSKAAGGGPTNGAPGSADVSDSGRYVVYSSGADNIAPPDVNNAFDVYLYDRKTGRTRAITKDGDGDSLDPRISADGSRVVFVSSAENLGPDHADPLSLTNVFVWTRSTGRIRQVDVALDGDSAESGAEAADISADGRHVAFSSLATDLVDRTVSGAQHIFVTDLRRGRTRVVDAQANGDSFSPSIDGDGNRVAYVSYADNLAPKQDLLTASIVVWRAGDPFRNLTPDPDNGSFTPSISDDGSRVAFQSGDQRVAADDDNMIDIYSALVDRRRTLLVSGNVTGNADHPAISGNGRYVAFTSPDDLSQSDQNGVQDAYRWSAARNTVVRLSGAADAPSGLARLSKDGTFAAFLSGDLTEYFPGDTNTFEDVFLRRFG